MLARRMLSLSASTDVGRAVVVVGHHRPADEALLVDLAPAHGRRPDRLHPGAVDVRHQEQLVVDLLEDFQVGRIEDVAVGVLDHHAHRIAQAAQAAAAFQVVLHVRVTVRNHLLEAGVDRQLRGLEAEQRGQQRAGQDDPQPVVEDGALEHMARTLVELRERADHRHVVERGGDVFKSEFLATIDRDRVGRARDRAYSSCGCSIATPRRPLRTSGIAGHGEAGAGHRVPSARGGGSAHRRRRSAARRRPASTAAGARPAATWPAVIEAVTPVSDGFPVLAAVARAPGGAAHAVGEHEAGLGQQAEPAALVRASAARRSGRWPGSRRSASPSSPTAYTPSLLPRMPYRW